MPLRAIPCSIGCCCCSLTHFPVSSEPPDWESGIANQRQNRVPERAESSNVQLRISFGLAAEVAHPGGFVSETKPLAESRVCIHCNARTNHAVASHSLLREHTAVYSTVLHGTLAFKESKHFNKSQKNISFKKEKGIQQTL